MHLIGFVLLLRLTLVLTDEVSYTNFKVYDVIEDRAGIPALRRNQNKFSMLTEHSISDKNNNPLALRSYLIPHEEEESFKKILDSSKAAYNVSVSDLGKEIEEEKKSMEVKGRRLSSELGFVGETYYSYEEMQMFLQKLSTVTHPHTGEPLAVLEPIGRTYEGRTMFLVKISSDHHANKPVIFFEAGIHAREWTAPASALYMMHQLVHNYTHSTDVLQHVDFYIIPLSNPDGYEYSRTADRLWRKTRSLNRGHYGVDGNRNFDFHWGEEGTSSDPDSNIYTGPFPFSEYETRNIRDAAKKYLDKINLFVSIHAYGPYIVYPWSLKKLPQAPKTDLMNVVANEAADAIRRYKGTNYVVGTSWYLMYDSSGGVDDYFKGILGVELSFTVELSPGLRGTFITPANKLLDIVAEAYEGFKAMASYASKCRPRTEHGVSPRSHPSMAHRVTWQPKWRRKSSSRSR